MLRSLGLIVRRLRRQPSFSLAAIVTLAVGIGASTAIFSALHAALLRPLPYPAAEDLYTLRTFFPDGRFTSGLVGGLELTRLQESSDRIIATAASTRDDETIVQKDGAVEVAAYDVSQGFFDLFGLPMTLGRGFTPEEHVRGAPHVAVLSHRLWHRLFNGDPAIVGSTIALVSGTATVVGIAHPAFDEPRRAEMWSNSYVPQNIGHTFDGYMRLRPGTKPDALRGQMDAVMDTLGREQPDQNRGRRFAVTPMLDAVVGDLKPILVIVFGATILLLVLAAANVTNLMLARGTGRLREVALRAALGASRTRLARDLVVESLTLTLAGGLLGVAMAYAAIEVMSRIGMARLPRLSTVTFEPAVVLFALAVMLITGLLVAVLPGLGLLRTDLRPLMNSETRSSIGSGPTRRLLGAMIVAEVAVAIVLVAGAGRLVSGFSNLFAVDPGFSATERLIVHVSLPWTRQQDASRIDAFMTEMRDRLRPLGVTAVATTSALPLAQERDSTTFVDFVGEPVPDPQQRPNARWRFASPEFFDVLGIRLRAGRGLTADDRADRLPVVVVNEAFVRRAARAACCSPGGPDA